MSHKEAITGTLKDRNITHKIIPTGPPYICKMKTMSSNLVIKYEIAIGTKLAPAVTAICIDDLEESFIENGRLKPELCVRYTNDVSITWSQ